MKYDKIFYKLYISILLLGLLTILTIGNHDLLILGDFDGLERKVVLLGLGMLIAALTFFKLHVPVVDI